MTSNLFKEFEFISEKAWKQQIQFDLDGKDYNKEVNWVSNEGINIKPFFTSKYKSKNKLYIPDNWNINQTIYLKEESISNEEIKKLISQEVYDLTIYIKSDSINLDLLFKEVDLTYLNLYFKIDHFNEVLLSNLNNYAKKNKTKFHLDYDLLGNYISTGNWKFSYKEDIEFFKGVINKLSYFKSVVQLKSSNYQNSGANIIQEIAYSMSQANEYVDVFGKEIIKKINFQIAVGSNYFFEIAKIQAYRILWKTISKYHEYPINDVHIIATPSRRNKTIFDFNNNVIRSTSECMAAILGGANSAFFISIIYKNENEFSKRISRNQLLILKHECHIDKVKNPNYTAAHNQLLKTLYFINNQSLLFKELDSRIKEGKKIDEIEKKIKESAQKEQLKFNDKIEILVGSNHYQNMDEKMKEQLEVNPFPTRKSEKTLIEPIIKKRLAGVIRAKKVIGEGKFKNIELEQLDNPSKKLSEFETSEGIMLKSRYSIEDFEKVEHTDFVSGIAPNLRGPYSTMYVIRPWTIRQYAGFSTAEESNAFYRRNLAAGTKRTICCI